MDVKRNVRRRRIERIKQLLDREGPAAEMDANEFLPEPPVMEANKHQATESQADITPAEWKPAPMPKMSEPVPIDPRMQDPEYVWKLRAKQGFSFETSVGSAPGNPPVDGDGDGEDWMRAWTRRFRTKGLICLFLLAAVWGLFQLRQPWAEQGQSVVKHYLSEPLRFESIAAWFEKTFGDAPTFIPVFQPDKRSEAIKANTGQQKRLYFAPLQGAVIREPFASGSTGVLLATEAGKPVGALDEGRVQSSELSELTGYTVTIAHPNGVQSLYGWVDQPRVAVGDWVKGGETIGYAGGDDESPGGILYFAVKVDQSYVNPADVVILD